MFVKASSTRTYVLSNHLTYYMLIFYHIATYEGAIKTTRIVYKVGQYIWAFFFYFVNHIRQSAFLIYKTPSFFFLQSHVASSFDQSVRMNEYNQFYLFCYCNFIQKNENTPEKKSVCKPTSHDLSFFFVRSSRPFFSRLLIHYTLSCCLIASRARYPTRTGPHISNAVEATNDYTLVYIHLPFDRHIHMYYRHIY